MPSKQPYGLYSVDKSRCPGCKKYPVLLQSDNIQEPMFYICWSCQKVFQVGVGEVATKDD